MIASQHSLQYLGHLSVERKIFVVFKAMLSYKTVKNQNQEILWTWVVLTDWWVGESDLGSSYKGYTGYKEVLGGKDDIGGPNQANPEALAFILWCPKAISEWFENPVILGLINELGLTPLPLVQTMSAFLTVFFVGELT